MTWSPLQICGISFISPYKEPAFLEFRKGLNVVCGASDTGKSFIVEAIDFLLGAKVTRDNHPLRPIPERDGYELAKLVLEADEDEVFTLQRSVSGGNFNKFQGNWLLNEPTVQAGSLNQKHEHGNSSTLSAYLLSLIGLQEKYVQKNQQGDTQSLSFRNLVRLVVVQEDEITKQSSPILSGQRTDKTMEYSVFKLLLTGVDDRALVVQAQRQAESLAIQQNNRAKVEFIDELIQEQQANLNGLEFNRTQAEEELSQLERQSVRQQEVLNEIQRDLNNRVENRRVLLERVESLSNRINEINSLLSRFELLQEHYRIDLERLASIEESGSLFVHFERQPCPLCGAFPHEQHQGDICDGDVERVVNAATAEIAKIEQLSAELTQTAEDLQSEAEELNMQRTELAPALQTINQEIQEITNPLRDAQNTFSEIIKRTSEIQRVIDIFNRIEQLHQKRSSFIFESVDEADSISSQVDISPTVLDDFAKKVQTLLQAWNFPGSDRVFFDESRKDLMIGGQTRTSRGKGLRAITHAAITIGLMEFCKEKNLSHPGFVVLDSPLLAYWQPEASEDREVLEGLDLKTKFYEYLADNHANSQIIIIENEHPPIFLEDKIAMTVFTKNPEQGRYGFFPTDEN